METEQTKDEKKGTKRPHTTGSVVPEDEKLTEWLERIWARGEVPDRVELWQMFGPHKATRGERIFYQIFKPNEKVDKEQTVKLSNELIEAAQNDADVLRRPASFQVAIVDRNRGATPTVRRLGPIQPKRTYAVAENGDTVEEGEGDDTKSGKQILLTYAQNAVAAGQWERARNDRVLGEAILLLINRNDRTEAQNERLMDKLFSMFQGLQDALDRSLDREHSRRKEEFKLEMWREGMRTARNLLPGLVADKQQHSPENGTPKKAPEVMCIENFLHDVEQADEKLAHALFGVFDENDKLVTPGIFTVDQFSILFRVRDGKLPVSALDDLMPSSGATISITQEQVNQALSAPGMTMGIGSSIVELMGLRSNAKKENHRG